MGRLTEIIHYLNSERVPAREWMRVHYRHFEPTLADEKSRERYRQRLQGIGTGRKKMKKIFDL